jgi:1,4-dihydroxy-2-naphthoate octaprenyltransferase
MSRLQAYAQLVRLPNLPSALADICLGVLVVLMPAAELPPLWWLRFPCLLLASACLYCGGMVWNDYFDVNQDRRERPQRPIPSGRVAPREAARLGAILLTGGVLSALLAGMFGAGSLPTVLAVLLAGAVLLYDGVLKHYWAGPLGMGLCRFLNVLLGLSITGGVDGWQGMLLALVVGLYVVGVTWFARTEARISNVRALQGAALVMLLGLLLAVPLPVVGSKTATSSLFPYLLVALGCVVGVPVARALESPVPSLVQAAVGRALLCLILLDAVLASALAGNVGLVLLLLLVPAFGLRRLRWLYAT